MLQFDFCQGGIFPLRPSAGLLLPDDFPNFSKKGFSKNSNNPGVVNFHGLVELIKEIEY